MIDLYLFSKRGHYSRDRMVVGFTPVSSTNKTDRHNITDMVESVVKHHNTNHLFGIRQKDYFLLFLHCKINI